MQKITHFFVGANSGAGFQNLFHEITDIENAYDFILLKGGPGVGKNTFMKEVGKTMEQAGTSVEYLWCSGDPDSLDGVVLPELRCAVADATAPHVLEPKYPAAVDRYLDLGRFYDLTAAKSAVHEVKKYTQDYKVAYQQAYHCLQAARQVELALGSRMKKEFDEEKLEKRIEGIIGRELTRGGKSVSQEKRRFLGSITHKGYVWRFDSVVALCDHIYEFEDTWGLAGNVLQKLNCAAKAKGFETVVCVAPEEPERIEHLLILDLSLAFITTRTDMEFAHKKHTKKIRVDAMLEEKKPKLQMRMIRELREDGVLYLQQAKTAHDLLEGLYNPYIDFDGVRSMAALEAGRLLSYL